MLHPVSIKQAYAAGVAIGLVSAVLLLVVTLAQAVDRSQAFI